jgi:hypothetical protein
MYRARAVSEEVVGERALLYSLKGSDERRPFHIRIFAPHAVDQETVNFQVSPGMARCVVAFVEIDVEVDFYGMDSMQAIALTANVDAYLKHYEKKYDFFWLTGEPYFEG